MSRSKFNSRALRQLAEDFLQEIAGEGDLPESEQEDLATSLVRQWITCDGNAALFLGERQFYLTLGRTPLGNPCLIPEPSPPGWVTILTQDWKIRPEELPDVFEQLNRGQSAEVTNDEGVPLRLWVNPRERSKGVEPLVKRSFPPVLKRDHRKIAVDILGDQFGQGLNPGEREALAGSLAQQWRKYEGVACLFLEGQQLVCTITEQDDGHCQVQVRRLPTKHEDLLCSLGFPPESLPEVLARINLDQEIDFQDSTGRPCRLWHDPRARRIHVDRLHPVGPGGHSNSPPIFCPKCSAVLKPWREGEPQLCPQCGQSISLS